MAYTIEISGEQVWLKQGGKNLGVLSNSSLDRRLFKHIDKLKFSTIQNVSYDFSQKGVTAYIKEKVRHRIFFNFEKLDCEIYYSIEDGKLHDGTGQEILTSKISGNFSNIKADEQAGNFLTYLKQDVMNRTHSYPSIKTAMQQLTKCHMSNIRKMHTLEVYLRKHDLEQMQLENVTKDVVRILREKKNNGEVISSSVLATVHLSKEYHTTYVKCLQENNSVYFEMLYYYKAKFAELISYFNYDELSLVNYVEHITKTQNIELKDTVQYLYDYANTYNTMNIKKFDKYPKYLRSMHDIATIKLNDFKLDNDVDLNNLYKLDFKDFTVDNNSSYNIVVPNNTKEIIEEGVVLRHCVASYITDVLKGNTKIIFLRDYSYGRWSSGNNKHLLTLEIKDGKLVQARGKLNRAPNTSEIEFMKEFCKSKKLEYKV